MQLSFKHIVSVLLIMTTLWSCKDDIVFDDSGESKLVALVVASTKDGVKATIKRSDLITQDTLSLPVNGATAKLYRNGGLVESHLSNSNGEVAFSFKPSMGDSLRIEIDKGEDHISGSSVVPREPDITEFRTTYRTTNTQGLLVTFLDSFTTRDYYMVSMLGHRYVYTFDNQGGIVDSTEVREPITMKSVNRLFFSENNIVNNRQDFELFDDRIINGENFDLFIDVDRFQLDAQPGKSSVKRLEVSLKLITADYYQFLTTLSLNRPIYGGPFSIASQVPSNLDGGYGIFASYTYDNEEINLE